MSPEMITRLLPDLLSMTAESESVEFKENNTDPNEIGELISAIANSAALMGKDRGFIVWGVNDSTHSVPGTSFSFAKSKVGNENLENWLSRLLFPRIDFRVHEGEVEGKRVVLLEVPAAVHTPVRFKDFEHIRVGSYRYKLRDYPEKERLLWNLLSSTPFEQEVAADELSATDVFRLIDVENALTSLQLPIPEAAGARLERLLSEKIVGRSGDRYSVSKLGAILFARRLSEFDRVARKALRLIEYEGDDRRTGVRETVGQLGYAAGFPKIIALLLRSLPKNEQLRQALRTEQCVYPDVAIREIVANALIHQDFRLTGTGPMIEVFRNRIEVTNPGVPLIDTLRFIDNAPISRNEGVASMMRRIGYCEERGSGIDKVITLIEISQLPAPDFCVQEQHTRVTLFGPQRLSEMSKRDRVRACYQHACLQVLTNRRMTNSSLRTRLGISASNYPLATAIIRDAITAGLVRPYEEHQSRKHASYVPFWA